MRAAPPRPGPPTAVVVAVAAVAGGFGATRLWPPGPEVPGGVAGRAVAALSVPGSRARVVRTLDGDTARIAFRDDEGRATVTVRYLGVDTPETVHPDRGVECFGPEASHHNRDWATGRVVRVRFDVERVDPYGRLLAALTPVGWRRSLSERLVAEGFGRVLAIAPNGTDAPRLRRVQLRAQQAGRGQWGRCGNALPSGT